MGCSEGLTGTGSMEQNWKNFKHKKTILNIPWFFQNLEWKRWSKNPQLSKISATYARQSRFYASLKNPFHGSNAVAYLGFPAPGGKVSFSALTQLVRGSIEAKSELGVKGGPKLTWALNIVVFRFVRKFHVTVTSGNWGQDLWILEIIIYRREWRIYGKWRPWQSSNVCPS